MTKEKKQIVVMVALVAVVGAVGAFQFISKGSSKPAPVVEADEKKDVIVAGIVEPPSGVDPFRYFGGTLEERDPFIPQAIVIDDKDDEKRQPFQPPPRETRPTNQISGTVNPVNPGGMTGGFGTNPNIDPSRALGAVTLQGIITGRVPMAILEGDDGRQVLVQVGSRLKSSKLKYNAVVMSIGNGKVRLKRNGRITTLEFEEETVDN